MSRCYSLCVCLLDGFSLFFFLDKKETKNQEKTKLSTALSGRTPAVFSGPRAPIATDSYQPDNSPVEIFANLLSLALLKQALSRSAA
jgi:hypothetical protein